MKELQLHYLAKIDNFIDLEDKKQKGAASGPGVIQPLIKKGLFWCGM